MAELLDRDPCDIEPARARLPRRRTRSGLAGGHHLLGTAQRWLYLAVVLDLYSRRVVGRDGRAPRP
jgi:hypothetical protein